VPVVKLLIMGLPSSGKTTFIKHVFEGKKYEQLKDYVPTFGVNIALYDYHGSEEVKVSAFDCGGQTSFIDTYMTDQWVPMLFAEVSAFLFFVDSSSRNTLDNARKLYGKYMDNVFKYSEDCVVHVLATKWDKHTLTAKELSKAFMDIEVDPVSVLDSSARETSAKIINRLIEKRLYVHRE
jgi:GTPase SAR1 family protein